MHYCAENPHTSAIYTLLKAQATIYSKNRKGLTPLHFAAWANNKVLIQALISAGAEIDCQDDNGCTALHIAAKRNNPGATKCLLRNGASTIIRSKSKKLLSTMHGATEIFALFKARIEGDRERAAALHNFQFRLPKIAFNFCRLDIGYQRYTFDKMLIVEGTP